jgi:hypothetical protein
MSSSNSKELAYLLLVFQRKGKKREKTPLGVMTQPALLGEGVTRRHQAAPHRANTHKNICMGQGGCVPWRVHTGK